MEFLKLAKILMEGKMNRFDLMKALWDLAEKLAQSEDKEDQRNAKMLEVAGNIVEDTHCSGNGKAMCIQAIEEVYE